MENPVVLYHGGCYDGFASAWVVRQRYPNAEFYPCFYGKDFPLEPTGRDIILVDFSYKRDKMLQLCAKAKSVYILDHHKTAQEDLKDLPTDNTNVIFDMNKSGAGIVWDALFYESPRPPIVDYVEDRDLWRFKLPNSKHINAWISILPISNPATDFDAWDAAGQLDIQEAIDKGGVVLDTIQAYTRYVNETHGCIKTLYYGPNIVVPMHEQEYKGFIAITACAAKMWISELSEYMLQHTPSAEISCIYFRRPDGTFEFSLRSREDGPDVSLIAKSYGGGGHTHAAGFQAKDLNCL